MISTTSKHTRFKLPPNDFSAETQLLGTIVIIASFFCIAILLAGVIGCNALPQPAPIKSRIITNDVPAAQEASQSSPKQNVEPSVQDRPYYGSTYWDEMLTSVYFYPQGTGNQGEPDVAVTHLKFSHREDDIWLCGDQRRNFEAGGKIRLVVTFEPNQSCATNWKLK